MSRRIIVEKQRLAALVLREKGRGFLVRLLRSPLLRWRYGRSAAVKLLIAPQDLRTVDPTRASDIVAGRYSLGGKTIDLGTGSPFSMAPPSPAWSEALFGFSWLRHLRAAERGEGAPTARRLVSAFLKDKARTSEQALDVSTTARRLLSFLAQAPLVLDGADRNQYLAFVRSISWQARYLMAVGPLSRDGMPRLMAALAATQAGLCLDGAAPLYRQAARRLGRELERQILADGGHVSRNPQNVLDLLLDLLPLRQSHAARGISPPQELISSIDRMMPMMRFFRHADGSLAAFNGMGYTQSHLIATLRTYDDVRGKPVREAMHSGYQRIEARDSVLLVDTGAPPEPDLSHEAHAGTLSFEFSADNCRIVVNCGAPGQGREAWRQLARSTAFHSTAVAGDMDSCIFGPEEGFGASLGRPIIDGPISVVVDRVEDDEATTIRARHDGYLATNGIIHERDLSLTTDGLAVFGSDRFFDQQGAVFRGRAKLTLRFHLHPGVTVELLETGDAAQLRLPTGRQWTFHAGGAPVSIAESVYFANPDGPRAAVQLVVTVQRGRFDAAEEVSWTFQRTGE
jgi:uncharacterized heparinase superfamily protein